MAEENIVTANEPDSSESTPSVEELVTELAKLKAESAKNKSALDKALKEKGEITKELKARRTESEQAEADRLEAEQARNAELESLRAEVNRARAEKAYTKISDAKIVGNLIEAVANGDHSRIAEIIDGEISLAVKKAEANWLGSRPQVSSGGNDNSGITQKQFDKMTYTQRAELFASDPETYKKFS